jgi:hypothetical protein
MLDHHGGRLYAKDNGQGSKAFGLCLLTFDLRAAGAM